MVQKEVRLVREWNYEVQKMIDFIEEHITENLTLDSIAQALHYSKFYCSRQFRLVVGRY